MYTLLFIHYYHLLIFQFICINNLIAYTDELLTLQTHSRMWVLDLHTGVQCPQRMLECQYCQFELPAVDLFEHQVWIYLTWYVLFKKLILGTLLSVLIRVVCYRMCVEIEQNIVKVAGSIRLREWIGHELQFHTILNAASQLR